MQEERCVGCKIKSNAVSILNISELSILEKGCFQNEFQKGELLFKEGMPARYIFFIRDGFVKLFKKGVSNKDYILNISKKGAFLGIQNLNKKRQDYYFSAKSITNVKVCLIDIESFDQLIRSNGTFATEVISYITNDEMNYFERLVNNVQQQLPGRLANTLMYFRNEVYNDKQFNLNLTKSELASLIGTSRESISRILMEFQKDGIIAMDKNQITILHEKKLKEIKLKG